MLKYILLASAMTISAPVLAQDKPADSQVAPTTQTAPTQTAPEATPASPDPAATDPAATDVASPNETVAEAAPADPAAAPVQTAAQPVTKADQIAQVVSTEFPSYDKDSSGSLNETEFSSWMVALKTASDPTTKAESAATKTWVNQAFATADTDKNKSLSKTEVTGFLTQGS